LEGGEVAITLVSGTPVNSGSMNFAGNAFALNTLDGDPLIVTYIINAASEELHNAEGKKMRMKKAVNGNQR
jgi:hypothetical protein